MTNARQRKKTLEEVETALRVYEKEVELSNMTPSSKKTYPLHPRTL